MWCVFLHALDTARKLIVEFRVLFPPLLRASSMPPAAFTHPASAQKREHELLLRSKRLFEDKLQSLQV